MTDGVDSKVELKLLQKDYNSVDCWSIIAKQMMSVRAPGLRGILGNRHAAGASLGIQVASVKQSATKRTF